MADHALLSPSAAPRWMNCPGSLEASRGIPDKGSSYAAEGTAAHELAARALTGGVDCWTLAGPESNDAPGIFFTQEMADAVQPYVDEVRARKATALSMFVEQRVEATAIHSECWGTSDVILVREDELEVIDLKFGMGVRVDAERNEQLMIYARGALEKYGPLLDIKRVRMTIIQPRLAHVSEWSCDLDELQEFVEAARIAAEHAVRCLDNGVVATGEDLFPSEDACRFCKAKARCPALADAVQTTTGVDFGMAFTNLDLAKPDEPGGVVPLENQMALVGMVEDWCKGVRAACETRLLAGTPVPGWKLVKGRQGPRKWADEAAAEDLLRKTWRLKVEDAYDMKVISPTSVEKLVKAGTISERQFVKAQPLIVRSEAGLSVAPESDKRPAEQAPSMAGEAAVAAAFTNINSDDLI